MSKPVVAGIDGSPESEHALGWAAREAAARRLPLRIVMAVRSAATRPGSDVVRDLLDRAAKLAGRHVPEDTVTAQAVPGYPRPALREESRYASLMVLGRRGAGGFADLRLGSVALDMCRNSACPVVVIPGHESAAAGDVVVGVDGSRYAQGALAFGFEVAGLHDLRLRAVSVAADRGEPAPAGEAELDDVEIVLEQALAGWREKYHGVPVIAEAERGHPVDVLRERSWNAGLVVVGHRSRGRLLGSVAHGLLHHAHCPVAVVVHRT